MPASPSVGFEEHCELDEDCDDGEEGHFYRVKRAFVPYRTGKKVASQVSSALDHLLLFSGYDKRIRPQVGGPPVTVVVNLSIRSMGPVDENVMAYSLDCYFRQSWVDDRLQYNATGVTELALNWAFLAKIWVPDTYVVNGKKSYLHKITVPNRFVRISPNGQVSYSQRLTLWASCPMDLKKFPLDSQNCPLIVGSFGYSAQDIVYNWAKPKAVSIDKLGLAQFHLKEFKSFEDIAVMNRRTRDSFRNDSIVQIDFLFERQTGFFLLQIYTPLTLIVFCSWVAFWLIKTEKGGEVPARTALGATSVLSVVNIGFGGKSRPQVGYATALDIFIILCFIAVFAALVEFACINFIDTFVKRRKKREEELAAAKAAAEALGKETVEEMVASIVPVAVIAMLDDNKSTVSNSLQVPNIHITETCEAIATVNRADDLSGIEAISRAEGIPPIAAVEEELGEEGEFEDIDDEEQTEEEKSPPEPTRIKNLMSRWSQYIFTKIEEYIEKRWGPVPDMYFYKNTTEVIWGIDAYARKAFPIVFFILQFIYWTSYLYIM